MLKIENLSVAYAKSERNAVCEASFRLEKGSFTALVGESGSGKSTIVSAALGLLPSSSRVSGSIIWKGVNLAAIDETDFRKYRWKELALVPQGALNSFTPVITIGAHIAEVLDVHLGIKGKEAENKIASLLEEVSLPKESAKKYPHELSGGECQRAALARAIAVNPKILICDEATSALDVLVQARIVDILLHLREVHEMSIIFITHDLPLVSSLTDRILIMNDGVVVESGPTKSVMTNPKSEYTTELLRSVI